MPYQRRTVWSSGEPLTADDLNAEFDAILAAFQGIGDGGGGGGGGGGIGGEGIVVNAGHDDFNPGGADPFAVRVANAVAEAVSSQRKVVWVPKWMWGYAQDTEWSASMFDPSVLVVREGALFPAYDPIAYGAKINDAATNNSPVFQVAFDHAASANGPGSPVVAVTIPGAYQLDSAVARPAGVPLLNWTGVTYTGNTVTGGTDVQGAGYPVNAHHYSPGGASKDDRLSSRPVGEVLALMIDGETSAIGTILVNLTDFHPEYDSTKVISVATSLYRIGGSTAAVVNSESSPTDPANSSWSFRVADMAGADITDTGVLLFAVFVMEAL